MNKSERIEELYVEIQNGRFSEPEETYKSCSELYSIGEMKNDEYVKSYALLYMADIDITLGNLNQSILHAKEVISRALTYHHYDLLMKAYNLVAVVFSIERDDVMSLTYSLKGLDYALAQNDYEMQSILFSNIGNTFSNYDSDYGLKYLLTSLELCNDAKSFHSHEKLNESSLYNLEVRITNIAVSYVYSHHYEKALELLSKYFDNSLNNIPVFVKIPYFFVLVKCYHNLGMLDEARSVCRKAANFHTSSLDSTEDFIFYSQIIQEYMELISYTEGKLFLDKFFCEEKNKGNAINQASLYELYIQYYKHEKMDDHLFNNYRYYHKYYKLGREMLRKNYINAIEKRYALTQEQEISKHYRQDAAELEIISQIDTMTNLMNRHGLNQYYQTHFSVCQAKKQSFGIMIIDIDCFKSFNDTQGHVAGDSCIKQVAKIISSTIPEAFIAARYGGDEFFIVCHSVSKDEFTHTASLLVDKVSEVMIPFPAYQPLGHVSISLGGIYCIPEEDMIIKDFMKAADAALYHVKESSRNGYEIKETILK